MFYHAVTEHLPENIAPELRQCGVDEQILFSNASASEQLGPESSSFTLAYFTNLVMTFSEPTVSYCPDAGCLIFFGTVPSTTCPAVCVLPRSIQ